MRRSKSQAVYKYLPEIWVAEKTETRVPVSARITNWNYVKMDGIYESFVEGEIKRQINIFGMRNGDITSFDLDTTRKTFEIVEPACNENVPDIIGEVSPLVFYCSSCGKAFQLRNSKDAKDRIGKMKCEVCGSKSIKQLSMIYACECGFAQPIQMPYVKGGKDLRYRPTENSFRMIYRDGRAEKYAQFAMACPTCATRLLPDNASSGRNYKPFTLRIVNLVDPREGTFYEKGIKAQKTIISRWFSKISEEDYEYILNNIELAFSEEFSDSGKKKQAEAQVRAMISDGIVKEELFDIILASLLGSSGNQKSIDTFVNECDRIFSYKMQNNKEEYEAWVNNYSFKLMQYNTLKHCKQVITLQDSISHLLEMDFIESADEVHQLNEKLGIKDMQVSCDIQILNCTYGYTRKSTDPKACNNKNHRLKLMAYNKTKDVSANLVFSSKLNTEGILFDISQKKIIEWLYQNQIISEEALPDLEDEISVKKWYAENVHGDQITMFGDIDDSEAITKYVFSLLHSLSHAFLNAAGQISGLSGNSLAEMVIIETASIFIYAQTSQGIPLGALSGLVESNYAYFLNMVYEQSRECVFDPICTERDDTACGMCLVIPEISCSYFNSLLGRKFLYSIDGIKNPAVGFWEMK